jgi:hypothetical protein
MSLFRLAYPEVQAALVAALARSDLRVINRRHLLNLQSLFEWFIPQVVTYYLMCIRCIYLIFLKYRLLSTTYSILVVNMLLVT